MSPSIKFLSSIWVWKLRSLEKFLNWFSFKFEWHWSRVLGHEDMHAKMVLIMFGTLFLGQILLFVWQKKSKRTYDLATLIGMLLIPVGYSVVYGFWRFLVIWTVYALVTAIVCRKVKFFTYYFNSLFHHI